jgi:hypothetical protein
LHPQNHETLINSHFQILEGWKFSQKKPFSRGKTIARLKIMRHKRYLAFCPWNPKNDFISKQNSGELYKKAPTGQFLIIRKTLTEFT